MCAISGTSGSSGLGSVSSEQIDSSTCEAQQTRVTRASGQHQAWSGAQGPAEALGCGSQVTFETVKAGLHCSFRMSRHMLPLELMLGWYTFVAKLTCHNAQYCCGDLAASVTMGAAMVTMRNVWTMNAGAAAISHTRRDVHVLSSLAEAPLVV